MRKTETDPVRLWDWNTYIVVGVLKTWGEWITGIAATLSTLLDSWTKFR